MFFRGIFRSLAIFFIGETLF